MNKHEKKLALPLFDEETEWQKEWQGMPEFIQPNRESISHVVVHFESDEDRAEFSKIVGYNVTRKTVGFFFPVKKRNVDMAYSDEGK